MTRDMEIKNTLTVTRGEEGRRITGERRGKGKSKNMCRGSTGTGNGVEIDCGKGVWGCSGQERAVGKNIGQLQLNNN